MTKKGENTVKLSGPEAKALIEREGYIMSPLVILQHLGAPIFIPRQHLVRSRKSRARYHPEMAEYADIQNWADVPCSMEMFHVFFNGYPKSKRHREEITKSMREFDERWNTNRRSDAHKGETVEEFLARGGVVKTLPRCEIDLSEFPYYIVPQFHLDRRDPQDVKPLKTDGEF